MAVQTSFCLVIAIFTSWLCSSSHGHKFYVGGKDGWVINPSESYSHWANRNRFQINDTLVFKLKKGEDSVLVVTEENYNGCNINNPIKSLTDEESEYKFERSGPHFFISGNSDHCNKGQKIIITVLAIRQAPPSPTTPGSVPSPPATPSTQAPGPSPVIPDSPPHSEKKNAGVVYSSSLVGVVLSVVIGFGVFFG